MAKRAGLEALAMCSLSSNGYFCISDASESVAIEFNKLVETRNRKMPELINAPQKAVDKAGKLLKSRRDDDYEEDYKYLIPSNLKDVIEEE